MNLLAETINAIHGSGHYIKDIVFIGSEQSGHRCTWKRFKELADFVIGANTEDSVARYLRDDWQRRRGTGPRRTA